MPRRDVNKLTSSRHPFDSFVFFREFLGIALGLLDVCYRTNEDLAQQLLTYNLENWGDQCCLSLAVATRHEEFVAHTCCQTLLTKIWMGAMKMGEWASLGVIILLFAFVGKVRYC